MNCKLYRDGRMSVDSDVYPKNPKTKPRALPDCGQVFEHVGYEVSWKEPELNRLKGVLQSRDCVNVAALERLGWLRENQLDEISLL